MEVSDKDLLCIINVAVFCTLYVKIRESILVKAGEHSQERLSNYFDFFDRQDACLYYNFLFIREPGLQSRIVGQEAVTQGTMII